MARDISQGDNPDNHLKALYAPALLQSMGMDPFPRLIPVMKANGKILPHDCSLQGLEKVWLVETLECQIL